MSDYTKLTDFASKDALPTGDPEKTAFGTDVDAELNALATMSATKEDKVNKGAANGYCPLDGSGRVDRTDMPTGSSYTDTAEEYSAGKGSAWVALTDGATITPNAALGNHFAVTLGGNRTMAAPSNLDRDGQVFTFLLAQDATGSRTVTWNSIYKWPSATPPTLSSGALDVDIVTGIYREATGFIYMNTTGLDFG